eukprot:m.33093 g.33093  ORF g.33093 m.33093 type:complete len:87 (-) comp9833_c0_seq2:1112-1372(-)
MTPSNQHVVGGNMIVWKSFNFPSKLQHKNHPGPVPWKRCANSVQCGAVYVYVYLYLHACGFGTYACVAFCVCIYSLDGFSIKNIRK